MAKSFTGAKKDFLTLYGKNAGNVSACCRALEISRQTYYGWLRKDERFKEAIENEDEAKLDTFESKLIQLGMEGSVTALMFFLRTKGKHRGYAPHLEMKVEMTAKHEFSFMSEKELEAEIARLKANLGEDDTQDAEYEMIEGIEDGHPDREGNPLNLPQKRDRSNWNIKEQEPVGRMLEDKSERGQRMRKRWKRDEELNSDRD